MCRRRAHHVQVAALSAGLEVGDQPGDVHDDVVVDLEVEVRPELAGQLAEKLQGLGRQVRVGVGGVQAQDVAELLGLRLDRPLRRVVRLLPAPRAARSVVDNQGLGDVQGPRSRRG